MGIRSDVGLVVTQKLDDWIRSEDNDDVISLLDNADEMYEKDGQILYVFRNEKWYNDEDGTEYQAIEEMLSDYDDENPGEYYLQHVCSETEFIEAKGTFYNNHFNLSYELNLYYNH